jgi:hypothetical protein
MRVFPGGGWRAFALAAAVVVYLGGGALVPQAAAARAARKPAARKKPGARKSPKKKGVGLDLPPLRPGRSCYQVGAEVPEPALMKTAEIKVPHKAKGGTLKSVLLVYEVTVDKTGRISEVKTLGVRPKEPPWPQLHEAAIDALKQYRYAKTLVRSAPAPVCLMVTLNLDLR